MVCPQLHLSLQSGSPEVLRRMGRGHYGPEDALRFVDGLGRLWPRFGLGADLLVGFPGETERDFGQTMELCAALPLTYAHVFPYSARPGTPAARFPDQVPHRVKKARAKRLRDLAGGKKRTFLAGLAGLDRLVVAVEGDGSAEVAWSGSPARGVSEHYADCVFAAGQGGAGGRQPARALVPVRPVGLDETGACLVVAPLAAGQGGA
jgi:tRNA A37 methylthiotransferase MiaB